MYTDALSFLEDERDAWRPYEALATLTDDELERPVAAAHGWSGRDLMGHMLTWQLLSLDVARELALGEGSNSRARAEADWEERGSDAVNAEAERDWRARPLTELRDEFARVAGELRGFLTVVPETRWLKNADQQRFFYEETTEHYEDHRADLGAILDSVQQGIVTDDVLSDLSLSDVLAAAAEELAGVSVVSVGDVTSWSVAATPFATLTEGLAEFCLDSLVAAAAMRTPDTAASSRGPDWVAFGPSLLDDAAIDRAEAWFLSAHRRLTAGRRATRLD